MKILRFRTGRRKSFRSMYLLIFLIFAILASPAFAATENEITITADRLVTDNENQVAVFSGNVRAVQEGTEIKAEKLKIFYKQSGTQSESVSAGQDAIRKIEAAGKVDILMDGNSALADKAIYDAEKGVLVLSGQQAVIKNGKNSVAGETITLYRNENRMTVESPKKQRVKAVFFSSKGGIR